MEKHYICTGGCHGVSETPGVCQAKNCHKQGEPLEPCDCQDGKHGASADQDREPSDEENGE